MIKQPQPPGFRDHVYQFTFQIAAGEEHIWQWLNDTRTFTDTQVWPWKVEFYSPDPDRIPNGFHAGVLTNHFGPLINLAGELIHVDHHYRDLQYFYGSYAVGFRWIRPYRLEFRTESKGDLTVVSGTLRSYVRPFISGFWTRVQKVFWKRFRRWAKKSVLQVAKRASSELQVG